MNLRRIELQGFSILAPQEWQDITATLPEGNAPLTIADPENGVGALQFSPAIYREGPIPLPSTDELASMVQDFAERRALGSPVSTMTFVGGVTGASADFHAGDDFVAAWYLSDGKNIMLVTYVSDWKSKDVEINERDAIVRSVRFLDS